MSILLKTQSVLTLALLALIVSANGLWGQDDVEALEEEAVRKAVDSVAAAVIRFETIGGTQRVDGAVVPHGPSTGVVVSKDGYAVSSSFNFAHQPASIFAYLPNGKRASAEIVGKDLSRKIVLLKIQSDFEFRVPKPANPETIHIGATVIAVGRVLDPDMPNVSTGIVSAKNRVWNRALQTDAKISPANFGGPLLDLSGKVIGILVPMSPDDDGEMAGTEWYDSGIGFAVSFTDVLRRFDDLKAGMTLRPGIMGISLKGSDIYVDPAVVAFCRGSSPAGKSGIRPGDEIVEVNGQVVRRQAEMKHALGPLYEGETAAIVVLREGKRLPFKVELVGEVEPFVPPGIGLLADSRLIVQRVFKDSNAESAGIQAGDRVTRYDGIELVDRSDLRLRIAASEIQSEISLTVEREGELLSLETTIGKLDARVPSNSLGAAGDRRAANVIQLKLAEVPNVCMAIVPKAKDDETDPSLLVWIPEPGKLKKEAIENAWLENCRTANVVVLIPRSTHEKRWDPGEIDFIVSAVDALAKKVPIDRSRVVVGGAKTGGAMASLIAFSQRDLFRGLVLINSNLSRRVRNVAISPIEPMMILVGSASEFDANQAASIERLEKANFPVHVETKPAAAAVAAWTKDVLRWVEAVNRF